jgi:DNA-binding NtrC family response regulator
MKARVICATNRSLGHDVDAGLFREDLYYRVACLHIRVPRLRERRQDIPMLAEALLERISASLGRNIELNKEVHAELQKHDYPGNIRELRNLLNIAAAQSMDGEIRQPQVAMVTEQMQARRDSRAGQRCVGPSPAELEEIESASSLQNLESKHISQLLAAHEGNRRKVAKVLGISERTIYRKLKRYGLG